MKKNTFGGHASISAYVRSKLRRLDAMDCSFYSMYQLMFSEEENIMYEKSAASRIEITSYGESRERISRRAFALEALLSSCPKDAVVGLYMQNSLAWIEIFWAILHSGFCPLLMNSRLDKETLEATLETAGAVAVISDGCPFSLPTFPPEQILGDTPSGNRTFGQRIYVMSSGTSANVKLCSYTAREFRYLIKSSFGIIRQCADIKKHYEGQLKLLTFLPFYHVFGLIAVYIWFAFFARTFVHLSDLDPQTILTTIRRHKVTHIFAVPMFWERVYDEALRTIRKRGEETFRRFQKGMDIAARLGDVPPAGRLFSRVAFREVRENLFGESISFMITGGSEIRPEVLRFFNAIGYPLSNGYGMTEIGITSVELSSAFSVRAAGFVGKPLSYLEYSISPQGELLVRGESLAASITEGRVTHPRTGDWFHTGDLAECVKGHYRILGRKDDLIIGETGENLNPNLIEPKFNIPDVKQVCLIRDTAGGAVLLASVGRHLPGATLSRILRDLRDRITELGLNAQIGKVVAVDTELIREDEFKLNRRRIAQDYAAGLLQPVRPGETGQQRPQDPLFLRIAELFAIALERDPGDITPDTDFFLDCGGNSLDYFALISSLREEYRVEFPTADGVSLSTPGALYDFIRGGE